MKRMMTVWTFLVTVSAAAVLNAETVFGTLDGQILATGAGRVVKLDQSGNVIWSFKGANVSDVWLLPNGNVLFADNEAKEVDPKSGEIVWQYKAEFGKGGGTFGVQRLDSGNTLVGENSTGRLLEVDPEGRIVFELQLPGIERGSHNNLRYCRKLRNGNYLVAFKDQKRVCEYTPAGEVAQEIRLTNVAFSAVRLANGNTVVGHIDGVTEYSQEGEALWSFGLKDMPDGIKTGVICGIHALPNGNLVCGVYSIPVKEQSGAALFEVNRQKQIVWRYFKSGGDRVMMGVQKLAPDGSLLPGETLR